MSSSLKQCTITSEKSHTQIWRERLSIFKRMYCSPMKNAAKFSFDNFITSFCKMVAVATEICVKGLYLCCTPQFVAGCLFAFPFHVGQWSAVLNKAPLPPHPISPSPFFFRFGRCLDFSLCTGQWRSSWSTKSNNENKILYTTVA